MTPWVVVQPNHPATPTGHPLAEIVRGAADGHFPAVDGGWTRLPAWRPGTGAVVAFTGHAYICGAPGVPDATLTALGVDGFGGASHPAVLTALAGPGGWVDCLDALLVCRGRAPAGPTPLVPRPDLALVPRPDLALVPRPDLANHPRAVHARHTRDEVVVWGYPDRERGDVATVGRGLAGLTQVGVEASAPGTRSTLVADLLASLPPDELVLAGVAPGNARSARSLFRAGFEIIGSVQLFANDPTGRTA